MYLSSEQTWVNSKRASKDEYHQQDSREQAERPGVVEKRNGVPE
jgi:hypothetical protein